MGRIRSRQGSAALSHMHVRVWHSGIALGAMFVLMLLAAGPAMASSVAVSGTELVYTGDAGGNTLTVTQSGDSYTFDDSVAVTAGAGCAPDPTNANNAMCTLAGASLIRVTDGAGTDVITINSPTSSWVHVQGGVGDDTVTCGAAGNDIAIFDPGDVVTGCERLDDGLPPVPTITGGPSGVVNDPEQPFTFTSEPGATFECDLEGPTGPRDPFPCADGVTLGLSDPPDGDYVFYVTAIDEFGRRETAQRPFTLDKTAPQVTVSRRDPTDTSTAHFQFDVVGESAPVDLTCAVGSDTPVSCDQSQIFTTRQLADGEYVLFVTGTDAAGNKTTTEATFRINAVKGGGGVGPPTPAALVPKSKIIIESLVLISGRTVKMSRRGVVAITLTCAGTRRCTGRMKITTAEPVTRKSRKLVTLGSKRFSIGSNKKRTIKTHFSKKRQRLARKLKRFKAKVVINEVDSRGNARISSRVFTLRAR